MPDERSRLVYSTDGGRVRRPPSPSRKAQPPTRKTPDPADGVVRIRREKGGRGGKVATTISGLPGDPDSLDALLKQLKQLCGAGGSRNGRVLEIQGDHRERIERKLTELGHAVKLAGG